jgi:hypothetical protein
MCVLAPRLDRRHAVVSVLRRRVHGGRHERFALQTKYFSDDQNLETVRTEYDGMPRHRKALEHKPLTGGGLLATVLSCPVTDPSARRAAAPGFDAVPMPVPRVPQPPHGATHSDVRSPDPTRLRECRAPAERGTTGHSEWARDLCGRADLFLTPEVATDFVVDHRPWPVTSLRTESTDRRSDRVPAGPLPVQCLD